MLFAAVARRAFSWDAPRAFGHEVIIVVDALRECVVIPPVTAPSAPEVQEKSEHEEKDEAEDTRDDNTNKLAFGEPSHGRGARGAAGCCW